MQLADVVERIIAKARSGPSCGRQLDHPRHGQQLLADVDRDKAESLGVPVQDVYTTLQTMFGSLYVSQFPKNSRLFQVILQAEPDYRTTPEDLGQFYVRNRDGQDGAAQGGGHDPLRGRRRHRHALQQLPAAITGAPAPGYSSGQALAAMGRSRRRCCRQASASPGPASHAKR